MLATPSDHALHLISWPIRYSVAQYERGHNDLSAVTNVSLVFSVVHIRVQRVSWMEGEGQGRRRRRRRKRCCQHWLRSSTVWVWVTNWAPFRRSRLTMKAL